MNKKNRKPAIRFKAFNDPWEQRKLGQLAEIVGGGTPDTTVKEYWNGDINWYAPAEISDKIFLESSQRKITPLGLQKSSARLLPPGTVLFTSRAGIGNTAILQTEATTNQGFQSIVPHQNELNTYFIYSCTTHLKRYAETVAGGSTFLEISKKMMEKMPLFVPVIEEQKKVGVFYKKLDDLITLHQRKLDKLQNVKKACLEKMFPQNGESVPRIRFKGFTDTWEQRKLGNEATEVIAGGDVDKTSILSKGKFPVIANALSNDGIIGYYENEFRVKAPAVTVTGRGDVGHAKARETDFTPVVRLLSIKTKHNIHFLENAINTLHIVIESTGVPQLTVPQLSQYELSFPKKLEEELRIGAFFRTLDIVITLHQRKLDKLKNLKKACLEKMFV